MFIQSTDVHCANLRLDAGESDPGPAFKEHPAKSVVRESEIVISQCDQGCGYGSQRLLPGAGDT